MLKKIILTSVFELMIFAIGLGQEDTIIMKIRDNFQSWQPIIDKELDSCDKFYNYVWGENYQFDKWTDKKLDEDTLTLCEAVSIIEQKDFGFFVYVATYSFSGDWYVATDYYYDKDKRLYFIFWRMNTFYSEEPLTVEKRMYFNKNGDKIQELQSIYKMNTNEKRDISFKDRDVDYKLSLNEMEFYKFWKND